MADKLFAAKENGENEINDFVKQKITESPKKFWEKISKVNTATSETFNKVMTVPISKDRAAEPVRPLRLWSDQKSCHLWSKPCNSVFRSDQ